MKKFLLTVSTGCLLAFGSMSISAPTEQVVEASSQVRYAETTTGLNFRTAPSTSSRVLGVLPKGTRIEVVDIVNSYWVKAKVKGYTGYASIKYLREVGGLDSGQASNVVDRVISTAKKQLGTPYRYGAPSGSTSSFDCSSFTQYVFGAHGINLPRNSRQQSNISGKTITSKSQLKKGDLIFFKTGYRSDGKIDHVAIYIGDGKIIHTLPNRGVRTDNLSGYWLSKAVGGKRVIN